MKITRLIKKYNKLRNELKIHNIGNTGHYAELIVANSIKAARNLNGVKKGFDIVCEKYGKIEVKSRTLPKKGTENRISIQKSKINQFNYLAYVLFDSDMNVKGGFLLPYSDVISLIENKKYARFNFKDVFNHENAIDITKKLKKAQDYI